MLLCGSSAYQWIQLLFVCFEIINFPEAVLYEMLCCFLKYILRSWFYNYTII